MVGGQASGVLVSLDRHYVAADGDDFAREPVLAELDDVVPPSWCLAWAMLGLGTFGPSVWAGRPVGNRAAAARLR